MNKGQIKSNRLNYLLKKALVGTKLPELQNIMTGWGMAKKTQELYLEELRRVLNK